MLLDGMQLDLDGREVWVKFLGRFNACNLTAVYATALLLGADRDEVLRTLSGLDTGGRPLRIDPLARRR